MKNQKQTPTKLLLFDGNNHFRRIASIKAFQFMSFNGRPTGYIAGTVKHVLSKIAQLQPDEVAVTFDGAGAKAEKQKQYGGFKAGRVSAMDQSMYHQMMVAKDVLKALGICVLQKDGVDADDTLGALAALPGRQVITDSNDKDLMQYLDDYHHQIRRHESVETVWTADRLIQQYGVRPDQWADYLALVGDSVDGIPGLEKCGPVEAQKLLHQFGNLNTILDSAKKHPHKFNEKLLKRILAQHEQLKVFQRLTTLDTSVISPRAMKTIEPRLKPKNYSTDLIPLLDNHGLNWIKTWTKAHKPNVLAKPAGLWS